MWLIVLLLIIILIGYCLAYIGKDIGVGMFWVGSAVLVVLVFLIPIYHFQTKKEIRAFIATFDTVKSFREHKSNSNEITALNIKIIEANQWLAKMKYNNKIFGPWYPDGIDELKPIE